MAEANYKRYLAPTNIGGLDLRPTQQAALEIQLRRKDEQHARDCADVPRMGCYAPYSGDWERDYRICRSVEKLTHRGGVTMTAHDGLLNPPRGKYPETMRDTSTAAERMLLRDLRSK